MFSQVSASGPGGGWQTPPRPGQTPPLGRHPPADGQQAGGTHPTGECIVVVHKSTYLGYLGKQLYFSLIL